MNTTDLDHVMSIVEWFNTSTASNRVGDLADAIDDAGQVSLVLALHGGTNPNGFQVGYERIDGAWTLVVWGTLDNRRDGIALEQIRSRATEAATATEAARELARLIEGLDIDRWVPCLSPLDQHQEGCACRECEP